jgi:GntR family transcriptional regulator
VSADEGKRLRYVEIADDIRSRIRDGRIEPGSRVGTFGSLGQDYDAAKGTIDKALGVLRREGIVVTVSGKGIFAANAGSAPPAGTLGEQVAELRAELADALGRIEGNLIELYGKTGNEYPWEELPDRQHAGGGKGGRSEQRA